MRRILLLLLFSSVLISCKDDDKEDRGYLTNVQNVKNGIIGTWESTVGGKWYTVYNVDGTTCSGLYPDKDWDSCTKYEILKSGTDYIIHRYYVGSDTGYSIWKIITLNEKVLEMKEVNGDRYFRDMRIK